MDEATKSFQLPMWELPGDHNPVACKNLIDGWPILGARAAGVVETFGDTKLQSILNEAPNYCDRSEPWRWRAHLLLFTNLFGMTSMSGGAATNYQVRIENFVARTSGGANQCAAYDGTGWTCQAQEGSKCTLDEGEPAEGTDLCNPAPG